MTTYDRNRNAITTGSRVMVSGTGHTGKILSIDTEGLTACLLYTSPSPRDRG